MAHSIFLSQSAWELRSAHTHRVWPLATVPKATPVDLSFHPRGEARPAGFLERRCRSCCASKGNGRTNAAVGCPISARFLVPGSAQGEDSRMKCGTRKPCAPPLRQGALFSKLRERLAEPRR